MKKLVCPLAALALAGCFQDEPLPPGVTPPDPVVMSGDLETDIRDTTHVSLSITGADLTASLSVTRTFGVVPGAAISGAGHLESFPEAEMVMYTARFDAPADPSGPCGAQPISLSLSLRRRGQDAHVGGVLAAYCGKDTWHGVPARMIRLTGDVPLPG